MDSSRPVNRPFGDGEGPVGVDAAQQREAEARLREATQRLARHVAQSPLAIVEFDASMRLTQWTGAAERMFGWNAAEVLGKRVGDFRWILDEDAAALDAPPGDRQGRDPYQHSITRHYRKDGSVIRCEWYSSSLVDDRGDLRSILSLVLDVTDRYHLERELRAQTEQLIAANRLKDEFLATLSHELRTPLNAILGWAQILGNDHLPAERRKRGIESIARNAHIQARLVDDLLDVSRIMSASLRLNLEDIDLRGVAAQALDAIRPAADAKALRVVSDIDPTLRAHADPMRLQQVIWNLLSNAVKFTPPGGEVQLSARQDAGDIEVAVSDTGMGIAGPFLPHVFERFRQADSSSTRTHGGLGLGLAIVRHIVELHGGSVTVASDGPDCGSTFTVRLPASRTSRSGTIVSEGSQEPSLSLSGIRVLVVDDDQDGLEVVNEILRTADAEVVCVASPEEAFEMLDDFAPHVLVSDLAMPGTDGFELIRRLRASGRSLPVVALTAYGAMAERQAALRAGFDAHLVKPVVGRTLIATLSTLVEK